jgi:hypothetical protein
VPIDELPKQSVFHSNRSIRSSAEAGLKTRDHDRLKPRGHDALKTATTAEGIAATGG